MSPVVTDPSAPADVTVGDSERSPRDVSTPVALLAAVRVTAGALVWSILAVIGGLAVATGIAVLSWAIGGFNSSSTGRVLETGVDVFASGQALPLHLGPGTLSLIPLTVSALSMVLLCTVLGRGRLLADSMVAELINLAVAAVGYGVAAAVGAHLLGTAGAVDAHDWWRPALLAATVLGLQMVRGSIIVYRIGALLPDWVVSAGRAGTVAAATIFGGAGVVLTWGVVAAHSAAGHVLSLAAPGFGSGLGLTMVNVAFVPNAVVAASGYVTGAGFSIGAGTYSPLGSHLTTLPALPLLTAAPDHPGSTYADLLVLVVPLLAGVLAGWCLLRGIPARLDRIFGAAAAGVLTGAFLALAAAWARGGVTGGQWTDAGVDPLRVALLAGAEIALVAGIVALIAPDRTGPKPSLRDVLRRIRTPEPVVEPENPLDTDVDLEDAIDTDDDLEDALDTDDDLEEALDTDDDLEDAEDAEDAEEADDDLGRDEESSELDDEPEDALDDEPDSDFDTEFDGEADDEPEDLEEGFDLERDDDSADLKIISRADGTDPA